MATKKKVLKSLKKPRRKFHKGSHNQEGGEGSGNASFWIPHNPNTAEHSQGTSQETRKVPDRGSASTTSTTSYGSNTSSNVTPTNNRSATSSSNTASGSSVSNTAATTGGSSAYTPGTKVTTAQLQAKTQQVQDAMNDPNFDTTMRNALVKELQDMNTAFMSQNNIGAGEPGTGSAAGSSSSAGSAGAAGGAGIAYALGATNPFILGGSALLGGLLGR